MVDITDEGREHCNIGVAVGKIKCCEMTILEQLECEGQIEEDYLWMIVEEVIDGGLDYDSFDGLLRAMTNKGLINISNSFKEDPLRPRMIGH